MGRAPCCEKVGIKRGRWTAEEDQILSSYIQSNGEGSWRSLPKNADEKFDLNTNLVSVSFLSLVIGQCHSHSEL
ncbi:hypothetical protein F2Q70_00024234 [Brassica cretica]|uniref:Myb-like domain-containing protein n=1 Tax=Brassica cretica TaxID=69181 RepID=A0A8S9L6E0_BRACR|nr:hypothetical protein F2Q70_00024234 [Brassica cretica]